ncbi:MAG TPA: OB-fold domain-containing protein [Acidimicrobiales bacterium]|nr:OB-fold domain-containing protein [Acidimicrobiales bacterium]
MTAALRGVATYVPSGRLAVRELRRHWPAPGAPGGVRTVSVPAADEDVVTLAVQVADDVLGATGTDPDDVDLVVVASCTAPYAEHSSAAEVARAAGVARSARLVDLGGSTLGGVAGTALAADAVMAGTARVALVVAADQRRGATGTALEALGTGAAAVVVGPDGPVAVVGTAAWRHGVPTRWRPAASPVVLGYDDGRYEAVGQVGPAVRQVSAALAMADPAFVALGPVDARAAALVARAAGVEAPLGVAEVADVGDLGTAAPLVSLAESLEAAAAVGRAGVCVAVEPGSGAHGLALRVAAPLPAVRRRPAAVEVDYVGYLQRHGAVGSPAPPDPVVPHAATPAAARDDLVGSLVAGRCPACRGLNLPVRQRCAECGTSGLVPERAPRRGRVVTFNDQYVVAVHPEPAPVAVGVVRVAGDDGTRTGQVSVMFCDAPAGSLRIGAEVELVYRRMGVEGGLVKYGWKARPVEGGAR